MHHWNEFYNKCTDMIFNAFDRTQDGAICENELQLAVLRLVFQMPVTIYPPKPTYVSKIMSLVDLNIDGRLDQREFRIVMRYISGNLLMRVVSTSIIYASSPIVGAALYALLTHVPTQDWPLWMQCGGTVFHDLRLWSPFLTYAVIYVWRMVANPLIDMFFESRARHLAKLLDRNLLWWDVMACDMEVIWQEHPARHADAEGGWQVRP